jgi:hypothetical protein
VPDRTAALLARVAEFLRSLKPDELDALEAGEARLQVVFKTARAKAPATLAVNAEQVNLDLKALQDRASAVQYLKDLRLKKPELVELARQLDVPLAASDTIDKAIAKIVEQKVGHRLDSDAIYARR